MSQPATHPELSALTKGDVVGTRTVALDRADLVRYAGASGDLNPIHWSESTARNAGLPGVIAHGMLTMGAAVQLVVDWCGDPAAVIDYQTRFTSMVPVADTVPGTPGAHLEITGKVGAVNQDQGTVRIDLTVTDPGQDGTRVLTKAQALARLGPAWAGEPA